MRGTNPIRPPAQGLGNVLDIQHVFPTLQGEGPYTGWPAVFIRLGGCNLACRFCDTEFENFTSRTVEEIVREVETLAQAGGERRRFLVVITGGEPLRQPIEKLCAALLAHGFKVQVETNGTLFRALPREVDVICSPKNTGAGYFPLRPDVLEQVNALKFIISAHDPNYGAVGEVGQAERGIPVYVQPMDEYDAAKNAKNLQYATALAMEHGFRLSLQTHKLLGIE